MSDARDQMSQALKNVVVPVLRANRFTGSFPHFRRCQQGGIDLFTFQFDKYGGGFVIEIGRCRPEGFTTHWGKQISPEKLRVWDLPPKQRARIQPTAGSGKDSWFRFDELAADIFTRTAASAALFIEQAERMFDDFEQVPKLGERSIQSPNPPLARHPKPEWP
jgi:hypothetical protein